jgi:hypothetical protein
VLSTTVFEALYNFGSNQLNLESALMLDLRFLLLAEAAPFAINVLTCALTLDEFDAGYPVA